MTTIQREAGELELPCECCAGQPDECDCDFVSAFGPVEVINDERGVVSVDSSGWYCLVHHYGEEG